MPTPVLIVCHPGHELRVHGWLCEAQPVVCVLTDGSGGGRLPRTESSRRVVETAGGIVGPVFGEVRDAELYQKLLDRDWPFFLGLADRLAAVIAGATGVQVGGVELGCRGEPITPTSPRWGEVAEVSGANPAGEGCGAGSDPSPGSCFALTDLSPTGRGGGVSAFPSRHPDDLKVISPHVVVADAAEGYNPGHDVCRLLADAAVIMSRRAVLNLAFPVTDLTLPGEPVQHLRLSADALTAKLAAAHGYAEMGDEVTAAVDRLGAEAFADERFYVVEPFRLPVGRPRYEAFGRDRVAAGRYSTVIHREHLEPLVTALRAHAQREPSCDR